MGSTTTADTNTTSQDQYWDEGTAVSDGKPRYDTARDAHGMYGNPSATEREYDGAYQNSKGKAGKPKGKAF
jgi:hypothetical protein